MADRAPKGGATSTKHRVLLANSTAIYGGGEFFVFELAKALRGRGHDVWVSCRPDNQLLTMCNEAGIPALPLEYPTDGKHIFRITGAMLRMIREHKVTVVHSNSNYDRTAGAFAAWRAGIAHVTNVHSLQSIQYNITHRIRNRMMTDFFLADGVEAKNILTGTDGIPESKISVFYHGVNADEMRHDPVLRKKIRAEFGVNDDTILIGNVSRFVPMKGLNYLLDAFARTAAAVPNGRLMLVGDGELAGALRAQVADLNLADNVIFTGFRSDLVALYSAFDMYVQSSVHGGGETISFATQQALSQELPVIVTRAGDVPENVREGVNGFVVDDCNPELLSVKMILLARDPELRARMGKESRSYLLSRFTTEKMVLFVENVYNTVTAARSHRG